MLGAILINQVAQGVRPPEEAREWFEQHTEAEQLPLLRDVGYMALQAGMIPADALVAAERTATKPGAPAVVLMGMAPPKVQLEKTLQLPKSEYTRTFLFLIGVLSIADARRRQLKCRDQCSHWWHKDLADENVVREIMAHSEDGELT